MLMHLKGIKWLHRLLRRHTMLLHEPDVGYTYGKGVACQALDEPATEKSIHQAIQQHPGHN